MEYVENVINQIQMNISVNLVILKDLRKILKIGPVEIRILMNLFKKHNLRQYIGRGVLNGYLMKNFKMLVTFPEVVLVKFIKPTG
jgi:hypothetical protein